MNNVPYEVLLAVQNKECCTCGNREGCRVLSDGSVCDYSISKEAKGYIRESKGFFGRV